MGRAFRVGRVSQEGFLEEVALLLGREDISESLQLSHLPQESSSRPPAQGHPELTVPQPPATPGDGKTQAMFSFILNNLLTRRSHNVKL